MKTYVNSLKMHAFAFTDKFFFYMISFKKVWRSKLLNIGMNNYHRILKNSVSWPKSVRIWLWVSDNALLLEKFTYSRTICYTVVKMFANCLTHTHDCKCTGTQLTDSITWSLFKESVQNFKYKEILFLVYIQIHVYASI